VDYIAEVTGAKKVEREKEVSGAIAVAVAITFSDTSSCENLRTRF
jgi:hypothetical protein